MKRAVRYAEKASEAAQQMEPDQKRAVKETKRQEKLSEKVVEQIEILEEKNETPIIPKMIAVKPKEQAPRPMQLGDTVLILSLQKEGTLVQLNGQEAEVQLGAMRMKINVDQLERVRKNADAPAAKAANEPRSEISKRISAAHPSPGMELDLRGERADDALDKLTRYLENASLAGLPFVRIIHGKGSGRLRDVVREAMDQSPYVNNWEEADQKEGGSGVTIVRIKQ